MSNKHLSVICFGDIRKRDNGYLVRCAMIVDKLLEEKNIVDVFQYCDRRGTYRDGNLTIINIDVKHEVKRNKPTIFENILGFSLFKEIYFQIEGFFKLSKYKNLLHDSREVYLEGTLLFQAFVFLKLIGARVTTDTHCINEDVSIKLRGIQPVQGFIRQIIWHVIEKTFAHMSAKLITVSELDKKFIVEHFHVNTHKIAVIPNTVVAANFQKYEKESIKIKIDFSNKYSRLICFIGDLSAIHNQKAREYIEKKLAPFMPNYLFMIIGKNPYDYKSHENLFYTGFVESVDPYIIASDICIAPLSIGSGTKTKVYDYMKYKKRVLATGIALEGIKHIDSNTRKIDLKDFPKEIEIEDRILRA